MRYLRDWLLAGWVGLVAAGCAPRGAPVTPSVLPPAPTVTAVESLAIAEAYRSHRWTGSHANAFHGVDAGGTRVDTPDIGYRPRAGLQAGWWVPGAVSVGIPYQWGGFDTPATFDQKVRAGYFAGDVYTAEKRRLLDSAVSGRAAGIDCSGFISRCWRLERSYSTRELESLCYALPAFDVLRPGDIVNKRNVHVLLFVRWTDASRTAFEAYETGSPPVWKVQRHPISVAFVKHQGYRPFRYRGMRP